MLQTGGFTRLINKALAGGTVRFPARHCFKRVPTDSETYLDKTCANASSWPELCIAVMELGTKYIYKEDLDITTNNVCGR